MPNSNRSLTDVLIASHLAKQKDATDPTRYLAPVSPDFVTTNNQIDAGFANILGGLAAPRDREQERQATISANADKNLERQLTIEAARVKSEDALELAGVNNDARAALETSRQTQKVGSPQYQLQKEQHADYLKKKADKEAVFGMADKLMKSGIGRGNQEDITAFIRANGGLRGDLYDALVTEYSARRADRETKDPTTALATEEYKTGGQAQFQQDNVSRLQAQDATFIEKTGLNTESLATLKDRRAALLSGAPASGITISEQLQKVEGFEGDQDVIGSILLAIEDHVPAGTTVSADIVEKAYLLSQAAEYTPFATDEAVATKYIVQALNQAGIGKAGNKEAAKVQRYLRSYDEITTANAAQQASFTKQLEAKATKYTKDNLVQSINKTLQIKGANPLGNLQAYGKNKGDDALRKQFQFTPPKPTSLSRGDILNETSQEAAARKAIQFEVDDVQFQLFQKKLEREDKKLKARAKG